MTTMKLLKKVKKVSAKKSSSSTGGTNQKWILITEYERFNSLKELENHFTEVEHDYSCFLSELDYYLVKENDLYTCDIAPEVKIKNIRKVKR